MIGQSLGPFRVLEKLGAGGMGEVYLAEDMRLGRKVALKRPGESWLREPDARARLQREARAAARLNNPKIAAVYDVIDLEDRPYIVMEYVEGETLAAHLRGGVISLERALAVGIELAEALSAAHSAGVIHRDLKPSNVVLTATGGIKVLDFGLAKTVSRAEDDPSAHLTHPGQVLGTPGYVAPEQLLGKPADARCDIYSVGAILYEMLTGRAPFQQGDSMGRALASLVERIPSAHELRPSVPPAISDVVERAMAREPQHRHQSADELKLALEQAAATLGETPTRLINAPESPRRRIQETLQIAAAVVLLLAVAGVPLSRWWKARPAVEETATAAARRAIIAVLPFENLTGDPSLGYLGAGMADAASTTLASLSNMSVIARSQITDALRQGNDDAKVCRALGATFVVRGAVHKAGSRLKVTLNVVGPDGRIESAGIVEDDYSNLFGLQNRLAEDLSRQLLGGVPAYGRAQPAQTPTRNVAALEHYWQGRALLDQPSRSGAIEAAVARFRDAIARDASFALAHAGLGDALWWKYRETRNPADAKAAIASSERARALAPDEPLVHLSLAQSYQETGRTEDAIRELDALLALQPNNDDGHRMLAALSERQGRPEDAIRHHQRAIAIRPGYWRNHGALGNYYVRSGRFAEAAIEFQRVTELQPDNAIGFLNLGAAYHNAGDYPRAVENYQRSIAINPTDYAYSNVGAVYHIQQRYAEAVAAHNEALKLSPEKPELHRNIADAYRKMGDEAAARKSYERAIQLATRALSVNAGDAAMLSLAALCEAKLSRSDRARQRIEEAIRRAPDSALVLVRAAAIEARAGNARGAIDLCERALSRGASRIVIREDDDFESIRQEPAFVRLTAERRGP